MAGNINGMGSKVQGAIDQGLQNGTINQDQAKQLNDDLGGLQQAFQSGDRSQIKSAMQKLHSDAKADGIKLPHAGHHGMKKIKQAADDGDPQAQQIMQQLAQWRAQQSSGDSLSSFSGMSNLQSQAQDNPYWSTQDIGISRK